MRPVTVHIFPLQEFKPDSANELRAPSHTDNFQKAVKLQQMINE